MGDHSTSKSNEMSPAPSADRDLPDHNTSDRWDDGLVAHG